MNLRIYILGIILTGNPLVMSLTHRPTERRKYIAKDRGLLYGLTSLSFFFQIDYILRANHIMFSCTQRSPIDGRRYIHGIIYAYYKRTKMYIDYIFFSNTHAGRVSLRSKRILGNGQWTYYIVNLASAIYG